ncbi:hypothetical protein SEA_FUZZBUSTER_16 [Microbacterium phage FuzzBuster]|uniref:Uncharacterized protein n=1 Tax=Microbacterium phage FuzzBuster TaxID=2590935 RepID=A0A516KUY5_9CAUD|nr:hypothetical protein SEA_FUZZBUSTER_16 [Microbacterium phage FuzzBuster]
MNGTTTCRFTGGIQDGMTMPLVVGPDGVPPSRVTFFAGTVALSYERVEHDDLLGGWIYRYTDPETAKKE